MKLTLKRIARKAEYTIGKLYIDGEYYCDTLEDTDRGLRQDMPLEEIQRLKVYARTAIPTGTYKVVVSMSPSKRRMLPRLLYVPGYEGILIHRGNTEHDSAGCILVGKNTQVGKVTASTRYELGLTQKLLAAGNDGIEIEIV